MVSILVGGVGGGIGNESESTFVASRRSIASPPVVAPPSNPGEHFVQSFQRAGHLEVGPVGGGNEPRRDR